MNLNVLEKVTRQVLKGESIDTRSNRMLGAGIISPAEHRSLQSLSSQIAANVQANNQIGTTAFVKPDLMWF